MWQELAPLHREQKHVHVRCNKHSLRTGQSATNREGYGYGYGQQSWGRRNLVLMAQLPFESRRPGKSKQDFLSHTHTHSTSWQKGHVAEKYVTPELNNKINDICPSSWASFLNSIKFYENAAIKLCLPRDTYV